MSRLDISELLQEAGFIQDRIADVSFGKPTPLPYVAYIHGRTEPFCADDTAFKKIQNIVIELYTDMRRDQKLIDRISEVLDRHEIIYETSEDYIESEKTYRVSFYFEEMI